MIIWILKSEQTHKIVIDGVNSSIWNIFFNVTGNFMENCEEMRVNEKVSTVKIKWYFCLFFFLLLKIANSILDDWSY